MRRRLIALTGALGLVAAALAATAGIGSAAPERSADTKLSLVAYSTPREAYGEAHPAVPEDAGRRRRQLHAVLRRVGRADARDQGRTRRRHRRALARSRHGRARRARASSTRSGRSSPTRAWSRTRSSSSSCATATRRRSRAGTTSSGRTSRSSRRTRSRRAAPAGTSWPRTASWRKQGKTDKQAQANLLKLWKNVAVQDTSARASLNTFNSGKGDVLLAYENEAYFSRMQGLDLQWVIPKTTILIENPIAVTKNSSDKAAANAFLRFLRTPAAQQVFADYGYRPVVKSVENANRKKFPVRPGLFTIDQLGLGGWEKVQKRFFDPEGGHHGPLPAPGRREHRLSEVAVSTPARSARLEGQGRHGPVPRLCDDLPHGHGRPPARRAHVGGDERGLAVVLGRGLEPGGRRRAEADARRVARRLAAERGARDDHGLGARPRRLPREDRRSTRSSTCPFALPTIVAGLTLLALYGPTSPVGIDVAFSRTAIVLALMFVTLPFVVRTVQPVLQELDPEIEEAAHSLGASTRDDVRAGRSSRTSSRGSSPASRSRSRRRSASSARS